MGAGCAAAPEPGRAPREAGAALMGAGRAGARRARDGDAAGATEKAARSGHDTPFLRLLKRRVGPTCAGPHVVGQGEEPRRRRVANEPTRWWTRACREPPRSGGRTDGPPTFDLLSKECPACHGSAGKESDKL